MVEEVRLASEVVACEAVCNRAREVGCSRNFGASGAKCVRGGEDVFMFGGVRRRWMRATPS